MKSLRFMLSVGLMSLSTVAFAQSDAQKSVAQSDTHAYKAVDTPAPNSDAQKSFDTMKTLAGIWTAKLTLDPPLPDINDKDMPGQVSMRVTSRGNALVHEMYGAGRPDSLRSSGHHAVPGRKSPHLGSLLRRRESTADGGQDLAGRQDGRIRFCRYFRWHATRTHAPRRVHRD